MKRNLSLATLALFLLAPLSGQDHGTARKGFAVGFDLFALTYGQVSFSMEVPLPSSLSITAALAYSPSGGWQPGFEYWYIQTELRAYADQRVRQNFYSGFGLAAYLSPNRLDFAQWAPLSGRSSAAFGAYGLLGYKYFPDSQGGFFLDPGFMMYALAPLDYQAPGGEDKGTFFYKAAAPMATLVAGWAF